MLGHSEHLVGKYVLQVKTLLLKTGRYTLGLLWAVSHTHGIPSPEGLLAATWEASTAEPRVSPGISPTPSDIGAEAVLPGAPEIGRHIRGPYRRTRNLRPAQRSGNTGGPRHQHGFSGGLAGKFLEQDDLAGLCDYLPRRRDGFAKPWPASSLGKHKRPSC